MSAELFNQTTVCLVSDSAPMDTFPLLNSRRPQPLTLEKLIKFIAFCQTSRPTLEFRLNDSSSPPKYLPIDLAQVIAGAISESPDAIQQAWGQFNYEIWSMSGRVPLSVMDIHIYDEYALPLGTGTKLSMHWVYLIKLTDSISAYRHIYPPTRVCNTVGCTGHRHSNNIKTLGELVTYKATLFTLREGSLPIYATSLYCRGKYLFINTWPTSHHRIL